MSTQYPTVATHPLLFLGNRAKRLAKLCELNAPDIVLESEFRMMQQALEAHRKKIGYDYQELLRRCGVHEFRVIDGGRETGK